MNFAIENQIINDVYMVNQAIKYDTPSTFLFNELLRRNMPEDGGKRMYRKGEHIFIEGEHANGLYCVINGKVKIVRLGDGGKEQIVRLAGGLDVIGYRALIAGQQYHASAVALEDTEVGYVPKKYFFDILCNDPEMAMQMMRLLSQDLDFSEIKRVDIATKSVKERVAELMLLLRETYGTREDGKTIDVNFSREELAAMVGAAKEVVIRAMALLKDENLISSSGRKITLLDIPGLIRTAKLLD